jgi:hypothetical protein
MVRLRVNSGMAVNPWPVGSRAATRRSRIRNAALDSGSPRRRRPDTRENTHPALLLSAWVSLLPALGTWLQVVALDVLARSSRAITRHSMRRPFRSNSAHVSPPELHKISCFHRRHPRHRYRRVDPSGPARRDRLRMARILAPTDAAEAVGGDGRTRLPRHVPIMFSIWSSTAYSPKPCCLCPTRRSWRCCGQRSQAVGDFPAWQSSILATRVPGTS